MYVHVSPNYSTTLEEEDNWIGKACKSTNSCQYYNVTTTQIYGNKTICFTYCWELRAYSHGLEMIQNKHKQMTYMWTQHHTPSGIIRHIYSDTEQLPWLQIQTYFWSNPFNTQLHFSGTTVLSLFSAPGSYKILVKPCSILDLYLNQLLILL